MQYFCRVEKVGDSFAVDFPDYPGVLTDGGTFEEALENAQDALDGVLSVSLRQGLPISEPVDRSREAGFHAVDVDVEKEIALMFRKMRGSHTQAEIAKRLDIPYQSYQRIERLSVGLSFKTVQKIAGAFGKKLHVVIS